MFLLTLLTNASRDANSVDPDQTAPTQAFKSGSTLFVEEAFKHSAAKFDMISTLRVNYLC